MRTFVRYGIERDDVAQTFHRVDAEAALQLVGGRCEPTLWLSILVRESTTAGELKRQHFTMAGEALGSGIALNWTSRQFDIGFEVTRRAGELNGAVTIKRDWW